MTKIKLLAQLFIRAYQKCNIATEGTSPALSSSGKEKNTAAANNDLDGHQFIISYAQFGRDSLFYMILGTEGWAAVIGLIRRSPDLRWPEADVEGESV